MQGLADGGVVDNAFLRHVQGGLAGRMGFDLEQTRTIEAAQPGEAVGLSTGFEFVQARDFARVDGHDHFAADFMRNVFFAAVGGHGADPLDRETRLERARPVIKPGVEHPAVVGALMCPDRGFLLEQSKGSDAPGPQQLPGRSQADQSSSNDQGIGRHGRRGRGLAKKKATLRMLPGRLDGEMSLT